MTSLFPRTEVKRQISKARSSLLENELLFWKLVIKEKELSIYPALPACTKIHGNHIALHGVESLQKKITTLQELINLVFSI